MSTLIQYTPRVRAKFSGAGDPLTPQTGAKVGDTYRNTTSYELFTCTGLSPQTWVGSQGSLSVDITASNHPSLNAMYTMDDIVGSTLNDSSVNGYDGTISGAITTPGLIGNDLTFDGIDDEVSLAQNVLFGQTHAITAWINIGAAHNGSIVNRYIGDINQKGMAFGFNADRRLLAITRQDGTNYYFAYTAVSSVPLGSWVFVAANINAGNDIELFIQGTQQAIDATVQNGTVATINYPVAPTTLGRGFLGGVIEELNGGLDQVRVFNRKLTQAEITTLYNSGLGA